MMENEEAIVYTVEDSIVVKASNPEVDSDVSKLSPLDRLMPPVAFHIWFFYSYTVERTELEEALQQLLNRYPELSGRLDLAAGEVKLTNEGAQLLFLEPASVSMTELKTRNFDYDLCVKHFNADTPVADEFLLKIAVQKLDNNDGMVLRFSAHHSLCDINSFYLLVADFCSQVRDKKFKFPAEEVICCKRLQYMNSSGEEPVFPHPEVEIVAPEKVQKFMPDLFADLMANPRKAEVLSISAEKLKILRKEVHAMKRISDSEEVACIPSTNDCIVSILYRAFARSEQLVNPDPERKMTMQLAVNTRFRRTPQVARTFFGNGSLTLELYPTWKEVESQNAYETAVQVRRLITGFNEEYIQSCLNKMDQDKSCMFSSLFHPKFTTTNWNTFFDWYNDANLGQGTPEKLGTYSRFLDRICLVLPGKEEGSLELIVGGKPEIMNNALDDHLIRKFFKFRNNSANI